tara:strand:- start:1202 stop:1489 length:288 start_codon:yes stop_codon:yes gene_type:complete
MSAANRKKAGQHPIAQLKKERDHPPNMNEPQIPSLHHAITNAAECRHSLPPLTAKQIARRAYLIYQTHGCSNGHDVADWLCAESELTAERFAQCE